MKTLISFEMKYLTLKKEKFQNQLFIFSNLFLATPWYDLTTSKRFKPTLCKIYGFVLIIFRIYCFIILVDDNTIKVSFNKILPFQKITTAFNFMILVTFNIATVLNASFNNTEKWRKLLENSQRINKSNKREFVFYLKCFIQHVFFFVFLLMKAMLGR